MGSSIHITTHHFLETRLAYLLIAPHPNHPIASWEISFRHFKVEFNINSFIRKKELQVEFGIIDWWYYHCCTNTAILRVIAKIVYISLEFNYHL